MAPSHKQWLIPFAVQLIPAGLLLIGGVFIRESPRWLFLRDRREEAIKNLCWMRNLPADDIYMIEEIGAIDQALEEQRSTIGLGFWKPFKAAGTSKRVMWRLFLGSMLFFWQNGAGINAINYYSPTVFKVSETLTLTSQESLIANDSCRVLASAARITVFSPLAFSASSRPSSPLCGCYGSSTVSVVVGCCLSVPPEDRFACGSLVRTSRSRSQRKTRRTRWMAVVSLLCSSFICGRCSTRRPGTEHRGFSTR